MIDPAEIHGKRIAMIAWGEKGAGGDDVAVFTGIADWDGRRLIMRREPDSSSFAIPDEWLDRLKAVEPDLKETLLGAEFHFSVTVGNLPDSEDVSAWCTAPDFLDTRKT